MPKNRKALFTATQGNKGDISRRGQISRVVGLLFVAVALLASCEQPNASITLNNNTADSLLMVRSSPERLDEVLASRPSWIITFAGMSATIGSTQSGDDFCTEVPYLVLRPLASLTETTAIADDGYITQSVTSDDFEIVAMKEAGYCWGELEATWDVDL